MTFGDGILATADGAGDQTANPVQTLDVKPDTDIAIGGAKATGAKAQATDAAKATSQEAGGADGTRKALEDATGAIVSKIDGVAAYPDASALVGAIAGD